MRKIAEQRITFALKGPPVAMHRPRFSRSNRLDGRGVRAIKDKKDTQYQTALMLEAQQAIMRWAQQNAKPWSGAGEWHLDIDFQVHDLRKRDLDNLAKNALDAMSGVVYNDDTQVVSVSMTKRLNRESPRTTITVRRVEGYLPEGTAGVGLGAP